jgi:hypothetical protein
MNLGQNLANDIDGTTRVLAIANVLREILAEAKLTVTQTIVDQAPILLRFGFSSTGQKE